MAQNNRQRSNVPDQFDDEFGIHELTPDFLVDPRHNRSQIEPMVHEQLHQSTLPQPGQSESFPLVNIQQEGQSSNPQLSLTGLPTFSSNYSEQRLSSPQTHFTPVRHAIAGPSSESMLNYSNPMNSARQTGEFVDPINSSNSSDVERLDQPIESYNFTSQSPSISLSEPTKSPIAMSPFLIPSTVASMTNSGISDSNSIERGNEMNESQMQMLLQPSLTIPSVDVAAFHAREMSRSGSGSTIFPIRSMHSQQTPFTTDSGNPQQMIDPYQTQDYGRSLFQSQIPSFQGAPQGFGTNDQRENSSTMSNLSSGSNTGISFDNQYSTHGNAPSQEQRLYFHRVEDMARNIVRPTQTPLSNSQNLNFGRSQFRLDSQSNFNRISSNSTRFAQNISMPSSSTQHRNITHRRVPAACNFCRIRKLRCDGNTPCRQCARRMIQCIYSEAAENRRQRRATVSAFTPSSMRTNTFGDRNVNANVARQNQGSSLPFTSTADSAANVVQPSNLQTSLSRLQSSNQDIQQNSNSSLENQRNVRNRTFEPPGQVLQSQQVQSSPFDDHRFRFSDSQIPSNTPLGTPQDIRYNEPNSGNHSQIGGLPTNWFPVSLHAPHRVPATGGNPAASSIVVGRQNTGQIGTQKSSSLQFGTTNNDWSNPPSSQTDRSMSNQDANRPQ